MLYKVLACINIIILLHKKTTNPNQNNNPISHTKKHVLTHHRSYNLNPYPPTPLHHLHVLH